MICPVRPKFLLSTSVTNVKNSKVEKELIETNMQGNKKTKDNSPSFIKQFHLGLSTVYKTLRADTDHEQNQNIEERVNILIDWNVVAFQDVVGSTGINLFVEFFQIRIVSRVKFLKLRKCDCAISNENGQLKIVFSNIDKKLTKSKALFQMLYVVY